MKLHELIDIKELEYLIANKYVSDRKHPSLPLRILNYTPAATEIKEWGHTLSYCRGLVYDLTDSEVYAIPFKKFWNHDDATHVKSLPQGLPCIYEKVDGSYLNLFFYKGTAIVSTRGSFESEQAIWAQKWVNENIDLNKVSLPETLFNYIFEVVIPTDKKVVDYDFSGLVLLGYTRLFDGTEYPPDRTLPWLPKAILAKEFGKTNDLSTLAARDEANAEGYVAVWYNQDSPAFRIKIKFETYKRLHRLYFQTSSTVIWELLKGDMSRLTLAEQLKGADENLVNWAMAVAFSILVKRGDLEQTSKEEFRYCIQQTNILCDLEAPEKDRRKAFASYATKSKNPGLLFILYDAQFDKYEEQLWKIVKPENYRYRDEGEDG